MIQIKPNYKVAIVCTTFNHEDYISDAIESFLAQKCSFDFQIIVHDDASSDQTASIIKSFEEKYPDRIVAIYQSENQYSKGVEGKLNKNQMINDLIDSEYVAICEGDDYWINPNKLQMQVDFLDEHPDYSASTHRAKVFDVKRNRFIKSTGTKSKILTAEDMIIGGGGIVPTASIVCRRDLYKLPPFGLYLGFGDYQRQIFLALYGDIRNFKEEMSVYRTNVPYSWTSRIKQAATESRINHQKTKMNLLIELDEFTNRKFSNAIELKILEMQLDLFINYKENIVELAYKIDLLSPVIIFSTSKCKSENRLVRRICRIVSLFKLLLSRI